MRRRSLRGPKRVPHVHVHSSGRYDRTAAQVARALRTYMVTNNADVITMTECANQRHRQVIASLCRRHDYTAIQGAGPYDDCVVLLKNRRFKAYHSAANRLTEMPQNRAKGGPFSTAITVVIKDLKGGVDLLYTVAHLTAGVEGDWGGDMDYREKVWKDAHKTWSYQTSIRRRRFKVRAVMVADWNLNLEKPRFRLLLKRLHPRLSLTWKRFPGPGTHGSRVIDGSLTNLKITRGARLLPDDSSSDHRPYREVLS